MTIETTTEITDADISALRTDAAAAGDHSQVLLCDRALGEVDDLERHRVFSMVLTEKERRLHRSLTDGECRVLCERAIRDARAQQR